MAKANIVLAAVTAVFGAGCFVLLQDAGVERDRVRALEAQLAQLQREMVADTTASQPVVSNPAPISEPPAQATPLPVPQASTQVAEKPAAQENSEWRAVLADPAYRRARLAEARLQVGRGYPQIVAELGLSTDEAKQFLDLLAEQMLRENERMMETQPGPNPMQWRKEFQAQVEKERRAFLGEERFRTWVEYVNSASARALVNDLRAQLATSTSPLREEQVKPLVKTLATEDQRHAAERRENYGAEVSIGGQWTEETPVDQQIEYMKRRAALIEQSLDRQQEVGETYLDSAQQREFNAMLDRRREQARVELESFRAQLEAAERTRSRSVERR